MQAPCCHSGWYSDIVDVREVRKETHFAVSILEKFLNLIGKKEEQKMRRLAENVFIHGRSGRPASES